MRALVITLMHFFNITMEPKRYYPRKSEKLFSFRAKELEFEISKDAAKRVIRPSLAILLIGVGVYIKGGILISTPIILLGLALLAWNK